MTTLHSCSYSSSVSLGCVTTSLTNLPQQQICFSFLPSLWYSILQLLNPWSADQAKNWEQAINPCSAPKMSCSVYPTIRQFMSQNGVKNIHFNLVDIRNRFTVFLDRVDRRPEQRHSWSDWHILLQSHLCKLFCKRLCRICRSNKERLTHFQEVSSALLIVVMKTEWFL